MVAPHEPIVLVHDGRVGVWLDRVDAEESLGMVEANVRVLDNRGGGLYVPGGARRAVDVLRHLRQVATSQPRDMGSAHSERMLTTTEAADRRGVSTQFIRRQAASGAYPGARRARGGWLIPEGAL